MQVQSLLPGFEAPRAPTDRLLFCAMPGARTAACVVERGERLRRECALRAPLLAARRFHITLQHLGNHAGLPQSLVERAVRAAAKVSHPPFAIDLDRVATFTGRSREPGQRPVVLLAADGGTALRGLDAALALELRRERFDARISKFTPHLTLLYDERWIPERGIEPVRWTVREFVLVRSLIGRGRPYDILGRWPLSGADAARTRVA